MKIVYLISKNDNLSLFPTKRVSSISRLNGMSVWMNGEGSYAWRCESAFLLNESILQKADSIQILKKIYMEVSRIIDSASGIRVFIHLGGLSPQAADRYNQMLFDITLRADFSDVEFYCISRNNKYPSELFNDFGNYAVPSRNAILDITRKLRVGFNENKYEFVRALNILDQIRNEPTDECKKHFNTLQTECRNHHSQEEMVNIKKEILE